MNSGIYEIYNKINGKRYIGSTIDFDRRFKEHKNDLINNRHHSVKLQRAWNRYSSDAFNFRIVHLVQYDLLILVEQFYIDSYNFHNDLYNTCSIAGNNSGYIHTEETKKRISDAHKGKKASLESRKRMAKAQKGNDNKKGKLASKETKINISLAKRRFNETKTLEIKKLRAEGMSCINIGKLYNCNRKMIHKYLKLY